MKITLKNLNTRKFLVGGAMPAGAPTEDPTMLESTTVEETPSDQGGEQDPIMMLALMSALALQNLDCNISMLVCQIFLEIINQMQGGASQEPLGQPVFKKGGQLVRRIKN